MKKIILGMVLIALIALTGCSSNTAKATETVTEQSTTQEETTTASETAVDRLRFIDMTKYQVNYAGNPGHITITTGAITSSGNYGGNYYIYLGDMIDGVIYLDKYNLTEEQYKSIDLTKVYTVNQ